MARDAARRPFEDAARVGNERSLASLVVGEVCAHGHGSGQPHLLNAPEIESRLPMTACRLYTPSYPAIVVHMSAENPTFVTDTKSPLASSWTTARPAVSTNVPGG